jgi:hypothetical protein
VGRAPMDFPNSKDGGLLSPWESVRRQVLADLANRGRSRFVRNNLRAYAELLRSEMNRRELNYTPINWPETNRGAPRRLCREKAPVGLRKFGPQRKLSFSTLSREEPTSNIRCMRSRFDPLGTFQMCRVRSLRSAPASLAEVAELERLELVQTRLSSPAEVRHASNRNEGSRL